MTVILDIQGKLSGFPARLRDAIAGQPRNAFAKKCGFPESLIRKYLNGDSQPGLEKLVTMAEAAGVSVAWLATGETAMERIESPSAIRGHVRIPVFEVRASAGGGRIVEAEFIEGTLTFQRAYLVDELRVHPEDLVLVHVEGESMEPTLRPGDLILVNRRDQLVRDGVYLVRIDDAVLVKRLQRLPGGRIEVISDNGAYKPFTVDLADESTAVAVIGRIIWSGRRM